MLPSSHPVPIRTDGRVLLDKTERPRPKSGGPRLPAPQKLADAFSEFISASAQLEASYRGLQLKVEYLSGELADRNAKLTQSVAENARMRAALEQMIDSLPCGVLVVDSCGAIVTINPEGRRLLGVDFSCLTNLSQLSQACRIAFADLPAAQTDERDTELCLAGESGERWVAIGRRELDSSAQDQGAGFTQLRTIWILRDVTAVRQAEREREAARRATALAEISSILAHEIRNPLASLELFAELIAQDPAAARQWITHLRAGIRTLSGTVNNVLRMNGESSLPLSALDLPACVHSAVEFVRPVAEQANVKLSFSSVQGALWIQGNEDGIRQIMLNLVCNAIRHTAQQGEIAVSISRHERSGERAAVVEVRDTGCGIPEEQLERLFDAGFSGTGETSGLGLTVCQRLMRRHGGTIRVSSRRNEGSSFYLEFAAL